MSRMEWILRSDPVLASIILSGLKVIPDVRSDAVKYRILTIIRLLKSINVNVDLALSGIKIYLLVRSTAKTYGVLSKEPTIPTANVKTISLSTTKL